jgi:hypothetical protein
MGIGSIGPRIESLTIRLKGTRVKVGFEAVRLLTRIGFPRGPCMSMAPGVDVLFLKI